MQNRWKKEIWDRLIHSRSNDTRQKCLVKIQPVSLLKIQTVRTGYRFRSRLEARWAVFFDALGLAWEYEPEGFDLGFGNLYLPDFRVVSPQGLVAWYEVKPRHLTSDRKFNAFRIRLETAEDYQGSATLLSGDPVDVLLDSTSAGVCARCGQVDLELLANSDLGGAGEPAIYCYLYCYPCDTDTPCGGGHAVQQGLTAPCTPHKGYLLVDGRNWAKHERLVRDAALAARAARFEHGENGGAR